MSERVAVVGGGVGGIAAAIRLARMGHAVTLFERRDFLGGKLDERVHDGYTFETGPSLLTLPQIFDDLFACAGLSLADEVSLRRLDPMCTYHFPDGSTLAMPASLEDAVDAVEAFAPGEGPAWRSFIERGARIWEISTRTFFAGPMSDMRKMFSERGSLRDVVGIDPLRTLDQVARRSFGDRRLVQLANRYATYSGSSPYKAPAALACIPAIESLYGAWYIHGGLARLRDALARAAEKVGVDVRTGTDVTCVRADGGRVLGVELGDGTYHPASVVVANVDAAHLYRDLLPDAHASRRIDATERSSSGFVVLAAVRGRTPGLGHHNIVFSADYRREFRELFETGTPVRHPTVYACVSSVTDSTQAPPDAENWFLLVNAPSQPVQWDRDAYAERMLAAIAPTYPTLAERIQWRDTITPADLAANFRTAGGAIYGTSSNGMRAAFRRPANRGPRAGLYLVGGSSHPGGGLPLVTRSAEIVAGLVAEDYPA